MFVAEATRWTVVPFTELGTARQEQIAGDPESCFRTWVWSRQPGMGLGWR